ncbi:MAG: hypothetical protein ISS18_04610 [Bacteroidales bacterium]|nr:hypothetical protein [Bacteroidales bacterium]
MDSVTVIIEEISNSDLELHYLAPPENLIYINTGINSYLTWDPPQTALDLTLYYLYRDKLGKCCL